MGRLFDAGQREIEVSEARNSREEIRRRAKEIDDMLSETLELEGASERLGDQLAEAQTVTTVQYTSFRAPGSKWNIEHAQAGYDYIYQVFPLRPPKLHWKNVMPLFIEAMDAVFPRNLEIIYIPPSERFELKYYTIRVEKITSLPGWASAAKGRALRGLSSVDAWPL